jgi:membrane protein DedA with SNARE-associated domain
MELQDWIGQYGYLAVFFGVMLEGESILLAAIYAIHHHYLLMWPVIMLCDARCDGDRSCVFLDWPSA